MSNAVVLAAHGRLAEGVQSGLNLIVGPMENLRVVNFVEGDTYDTIDKGLTDAYESLSSYNNILFITDLQGGTPFNRSVMLFADKDNVRVLSGLNFGLAYQALISETADINEYVNEVLETGRESINVYQKPAEKEDDFEGDGI